MRSGKQVEGSPDQRFWRAIEVAVGGECAEDIADVGRYVASRGVAAVDEFGVELGRALAALRDAGVPDVLRHATTPDGRSFADLPAADVDRGLEALILTGRRYFELLLEGPEREGGRGGSLPLVDLRQAVDTARAEPGIEAAPLWPERPGDRRRDGTLWIELFQGTGPGVPDWNSPPWTIPGVPERFRKAALVRSLDDVWRAWRSSIGARTLDVWLEYCLPEDELERVAVTRRGRRTSVTVYRHFPRLLAPGDPLQVAKSEADAVFDEILSTTRR